MKKIPLLISIVILEVALVSWISWRVYQRALFSRVAAAACEKLVFSELFSSSIESVRCLLRQLANFTLEPGKFQTHSGVGKETYVYTPVVPSDSSYTPILVVNGSNVDTLKTTLQRITDQTKWSPAQKGVLILTHTSTEYATSSSVEDGLIVYANESEAMSGSLSSLLRTIEQSFPALKTFPVLFMGDPCVQDPSTWVSPLRQILQNRCEN